MFPLFACIINLMLHPNRQHRYRGEQSLEDGGDGHKRVGLSAYIGRGKGRIYIGISTIRLG